MVEAGHNTRDVRELQSMIEEAPLQPASRKKRRLSRAARLQLIDDLSRWAASGLAVIAGAAIYLAIAVGRDFPARAAVWTLMIIAAMWFARRLQSQYRAGLVKSSRPFRWRASYTAALSVLGVAFGSSAILLSPDMYGNAGLLHVSAVTIIATFLAAMMHSAHLPSALAIIVPSTVFLTIKLLVATAPVIALSAVMISIFALTAIYFVNRSQSAMAARRNPWTRFLRKEIEREDYSSQSHRQSSPTQAQTDRLQGLR